MPVSDEEFDNPDKRIALICQALAEEIGLDDHNTQILYQAAPLHDVGNITVPREILDKTGKLTEAERAIIRRHTTAGFELLRSSTLEVKQAAACVAKTHHENWDGSGYPEGLKGKEIPLCGRITAIADVFDSLVSHRLYRKPWPPEEAFEYLVAQKGCKFDPALIDALVHIKEQLMSIEARFP